MNERKDFESITYVISDNNVHICKSYEITDDSEKIYYIEHLLANVNGLKEHRSPKSLLREWKAHNILFQRNMYINHTKDVDFEFKQKWYHAFAYWVIATFLKEKRL